MAFQFVDPKRTAQDVPITRLNIESSRLLSIRFHQSLVIGGNMRQNPGVSDLVPSTVGILALAGSLQIKLTSARRSCWFWVSDCPPFINVMSASKTPLFYQ
jgi:hypothetical protein